MQQGKVRWGDVRFDRLGIRALVAGGLLVGLLSATGVTSADDPTVAQIIIGCCAGAVALVAFCGGRTWWTEQSNGPLGEGPWSDTQLWAMSLGTAVLLVALPSSSVSWMAFVSIATTARSRDPSAAAVLLPAPVIALGYASWQAKSLISLSLAVVAIVLLQQRRRQLEAAELAAAQAQVIAQERARIASADHQREIAEQLHDVLAHTLSGLIVSLQTAGLQARQEDASPVLQQRLSAATELAREGLHGARQAVESLHGAAAATSEGPLDEWLRSTVDRLRTASDVHVTVVGDATAIPAVWREAARAVLRESLTNSVRHAPGLPVRITLADNEIHVLTVGDVSAIHRTEQVSGGHGLAGLRRRVEAAGGRFEAGVTTDGWLVSARWERQ